jgi:hypothetical protein
MGAWKVVGLAWTKAAETVAKTAARKAGLKDHL